MKHTPRTTTPLRTLARTKKYTSTSQVANTSLSTGHMSWCRCNHPLKSPIPKHDWLQGSGMPKPCSVLAGQAPP